ncbi:MAG: alkaline phosphatase family protein [Candidatus Latescibacterota bacterium]|nr:alkaline phosphatase family protein [Candidatus Latescibacterota bacterium]
MVSPDYSGGSIVNLASSVLAAFDVEPATSPCRQELLPGDTLRAPGGVALLVLDGLGHAQLSHALESGRIPFFASLIERAPRGLQQLTSVFPSTTTVALQSLATAQTPAVHGVLGHLMYLEELGHTCDLLRFTTVGTEPRRIDEEILAVQPTVYQRLAEVGVPSWLITNAEYEGSSFTSLLQRGSSLAAFTAQSQVAYVLEQSCQDNAGGHGFYSIYWPNIDSLSHRHGPNLAGARSEGCLREMEFIDLMLSQIAETCRRHLLSLVILADHGQTPLQPQRALRLNGEIAELLDRPPGGGRRVPYLSSPEPAALMANPDLIAAAQLIPADAAIAAGWFGGDCEEYRSRLGDVIAIAGKGRQLLYDYGHGAYEQLGSHGGLTREEMIVPLVAIPAW